MRYLTFLNQKPAGNAMNLDWRLVKQALYF